MILVDTTIVTVATPAIIGELDAEVNEVVWVTSAYLLAYAVPVLITGRLGDRFGQEPLPDRPDGLHPLVAVVRPDRHHRDPDPRARFQGLGAAMMTPADDGDHHPDLPLRAARRGDGALGRHRRRGHAGGPDPRRRTRRRARLGVDLLHQHPRRPSASRSPGLVPAPDPRPTASTGWASPSPASACSCWCSASRRAISTTGAPSVGPSPCSARHRRPVVFAVFVLWQARNRNEPLVPLGLFRDRNFCLSNIAITVMGFSFTASPSRSCSTPRWCAASPPPSRRC